MTYDKEIKILQNDEDIQKYPKCIFKVKSCTYELQNQDGQNSYVIKMNVEQTHWPTADQSIKANLVYCVFSDIYVNRPPSYKENGENSKLYIPFSISDYENVLKTIQSSTRIWVQYFVYDEKTKYADVHGDLKLLIY